MLFVSIGISIGLSSLPLSVENEEVHLLNIFPEDVPVSSNETDSRAFVRPVVVTRLATEHLCLHDRKCVNALLSTICSIRRFHSYSEVPILVYVLGTARHANRVLATAATTKRFNVVRTASTNKAHILTDAIESRKFSLALWLDAGQYVATTDLVMKMMIVLAHTRVDSCHHRIFLVSAIDIHLHSCQLARLVSMYVVVSSAVLFMALFMPT